MMSGKVRQSTSTPVTSDFIPPQEKEDEETTLYGFITDHLHRFFLDNIPVESVRELPLAYVYYLGTLAYMATIALFIYFTTSNYRATMSQAFIAVDTSSGSCTSVPITITNTYLADYNGNWIGSPDFVYSNAIYDFSFNGFSVESYDQYVAMMQYFKQEMYNIGQEGATHSLSYNLILWSSFITYYSVDHPSTTNYSTIGLGQLQYIQLSGAPEQIFSTQFQAHYFININGTCPLDATTSYDRANGIVIAGYIAKTYENDELCNSIAPMKNFGYTPKVNPDTFTLNLDVRTFATGMAVNFNYLNIAYLGKVGKIIFTFVADGITYSFGEYFDTRYYTMKTLYCISNLTPVPTDRNSVESMCFYAQGKLLALPVFNHFGGSEVYPDYCFCSESVGHSANCNLFNIMASLIFFPVSNIIPTKEVAPQTAQFFSDHSFSWPNLMEVLEGNHFDIDEITTNHNDLEAKTMGSSSPTDDIGSTAVVYVSVQVQRLLSLVNKFPSYNKFSRSAYNASWTASSTLYGVQANASKTSNWYSQVFNFCRIANNQVCNIEVFYLLDYVSQTVSDYKYRLQNGSCVNSLTLPEDKWQRLIDTPPVQLTQSYYKCYPTEFSAFFNAIGVASGNTSLAVPLLLFASLPLVYLILVILHQVPPKDEYSEEEKEEALEILSIILLRLRDGKSRGIKKDGVLTKLTKELISAAKEEGGFPDSDDENDEDEDDEDCKKKAAKKEQKVKKVKEAKNTETSSEAATEAPITKKSIRNVNIDSDDDDEEAINKSKANYDVEQGVPEHKPNRRQSAVIGRRGSVQGGGVAHRRDSAVRPLMGVFTKQIAMEEVQPVVKQSSTKATRKMKFEMFQEQDRLSRLSATSGQEMVELRKKSIAPDQISLSKNPLHPPSSLMNSSNNNNDLNSFMTIKISNNNIPEMHIMNEFDEEHDAELLVDIMQMEILTADDFIDLVNQLEEYFKQAVATKDEQIALHATKLSYKLTAVSITEFLSLDDPSIYLKLSNILAMHASLELEIDVKDVLSLYSENIAYNIGGKLVTAAKLPALCT